MSNSSYYLMKIAKISTGLFILISLFAVAVSAQTSAAQPRTDTLLNGLKVLMWPDNIGEQDRDPDPCTQRSRVRPTGTRRRDEIAHGEPVPERCSP